MQNLKTFMEALCEKTERCLKIDVKSVRLPHDRYLITDQVALYFSSGFDLLNNGRLRAVTVSHVPHGDATQLISRVESLPGV